MIVTGTSLILEDTPATMCANPVLPCALARTHIFMGQIRLENLWPQINISIFSPYLKVQPLARMVQVYFYLYNNYNCSVLKKLIVVLIAIFSRGTRTDCLRGLQNNLLILTIYKLMLSPF